MKTRYEITESIRKYEVLDCPIHKNKICILNRFKRIKISSSLINSHKSETDDGLSSCSNFPERPKPKKLEMDKPVLPEIENFNGKVTEEQLEAFKDVLDWNQDVFS